MINQTILIVCEMCLFKNYEQIRLENDLSFQIWFFGVFQKVLKNYILIISSKGSLCRSLLFSSIFCILILSVLEPFFIHLPPMFRKQKLIQWSAKLESSVLKSFCISAKLFPKTFPCFSICKRPFHHLMNRTQFWFLSKCNLRI